MRTIFAFLYKRILKHFLFLFDPETDHDFFTAFGEFLGRFSVTRNLTNFIYGYHGPDISKTVDGITYKTPVLLSAGFDYNARLPEILPHVGFGGEEIGSVTNRPTKGNEPPRLKRALRSQSFIVWKGLKNDGAKRIIERLRKKSSTIPKDFVLGVSIARTNDELTSTDEAGIDDYAACYKAFINANIGDYYTINISCPNAFGGETFAEKERLERLLKMITQSRNEKPIYVKLPINPPWEDIKALIDVCLQYKVQGVVIGNLNKNYDDLTIRSEAPAAFRGGLSGKPCRELSTQLIKKTRDYVGKNFTIIGVGGILSPEDALEKFDAGADLVMLISGMILEGPHLISDICDAIAQKQSLSV